MTGGGSAAGAAGPDLTGLSLYTPSSIVAMAIALLLAGLIAIITICAIPTRHLLYLGGPLNGKRSAAIPSWLNLLPFSPSLVSQWLRLSWHYGTWPWRLPQKMTPSSSIEWFDGSGGPREDDLLKTWDRAAVWREQDGCLPLSALRAWEGMGDPLADQALASIHNEKQTQPPTHDLLASIEATASTPNAPSAATAFQSHIKRRPPRGAGVLPLSWYAARDARRNRAQPQWLRDELARSHDDLIPQEEIEDPSLAARRQQEREAAYAAHEDKADLAEELAEERRLLKLGQDVFYRYSGGILLALLHFSLAGGFASPRLTGILRATGYLVPAQRQQGGGEKSGDKEADDEEKTKREGDKAWKRMIETTQWVLDVMETVDALEPASSTAADKSSSTSSKPAGPGRHASHQVRLLHARVRQRITTSHPTILSTGVVPLNQSDLLGTLLSFSAAPLASLSRMGLSLTQLERDAYLGVWRYVGWLMGVDERLVRRYLGSTGAADRALWSSVENLFDEKTLQANAATGVGLPPTYQILKGIADRPPFHTSFELHCALTTSLVGKSLSRALGLPRPTLAARLKVTTTYLGMWFTTTFGSLYPRRGWEARRLAVSRTLLRRLIVWNLDMKRSLYQGHAVGSAGMVDVPRDEPAAMREVRRYQWLMREMIGVCALGAVGLVAAGWYVVAYA